MTENNDEGLFETIKQLNKKVESLTNRLDSLTLCDLCMSEHKAVAIVPCGHVSCKACVENQKMCPYCDGRVQSILNIYYS
jgi:hypothetical protein